MPRVLRDGNEIYYVITFYIPRFFSLDATGRLTTVFHELYHVNEACDGDLRRFPGYESHHGASSRAFESGFQRDLAVYVASRRSRLFHDLLHLSYQEIVERYGSIRPRRIRRPVLSRDRATWEFGGIQLQGGSQPPIARN